MEYTNRDMSKKKSPTLLTAEDYMSDLAVKIDNAKQRVNMVATTFRADDKHTEAVIAAVERAAAERQPRFVPIHSLISNRRNSFCVRRAASHRAPFTP